MNHHESANDGALVSELREALAQLAIPERPPLAAVTSRGRAHHRRRLTGMASVGVAIAAVGSAVALGLTAGRSAAPTHDTITSPVHSTGSGVDAIRTSAFILTSNVNGTYTLTLTRSQALDPARLQQSLAERGIPALVKSGFYCTSNPAPPDSTSIQVNQTATHTIFVINPAAVPSGTELFFGYSSTEHSIFTTLIDVSSHTCSKTM